MASEVAKYGSPLVVDSMMVAKSRAPLLKPEAVNTLKERLLPLATVVASSGFEAERLSSMGIKKPRRGGGRRQENL